MTAVTELVSWANARLEALFHPPFFYYIVRIDFSRRVRVLNPGLRAKGRVTEKSSKNFLCSYGTRYVLVNFRAFDSVLCG